MHTDRASFPHLARDEIHGRFVPLKTSLLLEYFLDHAHDKVRSVLQKLFLQLTIHYDDHESIYLMLIVKVFIISLDLIYLFLIRLGFKDWKVQNVFPTLMFENNSQVTVPIDKIGSISAQMFLFKERIKKRVL
jgi:hypothetical protein